MVGFGVMRSPVGVSPGWQKDRKRSAFGSTPPKHPMPWLREAEKLVNLHRVGFASPLNRSPRSIGFPPMRSSTKTGTIAA